MVDIMVIMCVKVAWSQALCAAPALYSYKTASITLEAAANESTPK